MDKHNFMHSFILIQKANSLLPIFNGCIVARKCFANIFHKLPADYEATSTAPTRAPLKENEFWAEFCCAVRSLSSRISRWTESTHKATPGPLSGLREYWRVDMAVRRWAAKRIRTSGFTCDMRAANLAMMSARLGAEEESPRKSQKDAAWSRHKFCHCCGHRTHSRRTQEQRVWCWLFLASVVFVFCFFVFFKNLVKDHKLTVWKIIIKNKDVCVLESYGTKWK